MSEEMPEVRVDAEESIGTNAGENVRKYRMPKKTLEYVREKMPEYMSEKMLKYMSQMMSDRRRMIMCIDNRK